MVMVLALAKILTLIINFKHKSIMAKEKELSSNDKRRRTILYKKSSSELIDIVIRKDDVERKLHKTIETFKNLQENNDKRIAILKDSLAKSEEIQVSQEQTINNYSNIIDSLKATIVHKDETIKEYMKDVESYAKDCDSISKSLNARNKQCRILFYTVIALVIAFIVALIM